MMIGKRLDLVGGRDRTRQLIYPKKALILAQRAQNAHLKAYSQA